MIKSYECCPSKTNRDKRSVSRNYLKVNEYPSLCKVYNTIDPEYKFRVQVSKIHVWKIEITSIKRLLESPKTNEMEKLLLEDHQKLLQKEAWECSEELQRVFYEEYLQACPDKSISSYKIADAYIIEKSGMTRNIDVEKYSQLSPAEKIRLRIAQSGMLNMEKFALGRRKKSLQLDIYEKIFLDYRISFLEECIKSNENYIRRVFCEELPRDSPDVKEIYKEIEKANIEFGNYLKWSKFMRKNYLAYVEYYRYPYDFERPNDVSLYDWGSPDLNWKTGSDIPLKDQLKHLSKH